MAKGAWSSRAARLPSLQGEEIMTAGDRAKKRDHAETEEQPMQPLDQREGCSRTDLARAGSQ
jgi:hypothetical protein